MEKSHFLDRGEFSSIRQNIHRGDYVIICTKNKQKTAKEIKDLDVVKVKDILTSSPVHNRGIKVSGYPIYLDKFGNQLFDTPNSELLVGRITYLFDGQNIKTKEGTKKLKINSIINNNPSLSYLDIAHPIYLEAFYKIIGNLYASVIINPLSPNLEIYPSISTKAIIKDDNIIFKVEDNMVYSEKISYYLLNEDFQKINVKNKYELFNTFKNLEPKFFSKLLDLSTINETKML